MESKNRRTNRPKSRQSIANPLAVDSFIPDKDNATTNISDLQRDGGIMAPPSKKRLRGKSLGPGGLEALKESSGNAAKASMASQIRSILKPSVPLTPPKAIPSFHELRPRSAGKSKSPSMTNGDELLIDFSTPGPNHVQAPATSTSQTERNADPFSPTNLNSSLDLGNAQSDIKAVKADQEADLRRLAEKQAILDRRAARRKSMANRRVSFAPEATLHTWSVMELAEDSTTSSASNSTRRQSSMTASRSPTKVMSLPNSALEEPSTPPKQVDEPQVRASPEHQQDIHQQRRRLPNPGALDNASTTMDETLSSSPSGDIATESSPIRIENDGDSDDDEDGDFEGDTAMSMDESTSQSIESQGPESSTESSLDERLRNAASQAGTRGIQYDEFGEDMQENQQSSIVSTSSRPRPTSQTSQNTGPGDDATPDHDDSEDVSMDVTKAIGGIVVDSQSPQKNRRRSVASRRMSTARRRSSVDTTYSDDETMDFTAVNGGIFLNHEDRLQPNAETSDEEMTMELTKVVGGVLGKPNRNRPSQPFPLEDNETMEMTAAVGRILPPIEEQTEPQTDVEYEQTAAMDMTRAIGTILPAQAATKLYSSKAVEQNMRGRYQAATPEPGTPDINGASPSRLLESQHLVASIASETGSPNFNLKPRLSGRKHSVANQSTTPTTLPEITSRQGSALISNQITPTKQVTPALARAETPNKTPTAASISRINISPRKLFESDLKARNSPASHLKDSSRTRNSLFSRDEETGLQTPRVLLAAPRPRQLRRRSSGIGIDQEGYGSPRISELLDRRSSIVDAAAVFQANGQGQSRLAVEDPREIAEEVEAERMEEHRRESGRFVMETEANEQQDENATLQLKGMIESMTPIKNKPNKLKGRKSLAVGGAKGLLGKRPAELDEDEDGNGEVTPKRLKAISSEGSPLKKIHLPQPPTKEETTGRLTRAEQKRLDLFRNENSATPVNGQSPTKGNIGRSPQVVGRFKAIENEDADGRPASFEDRLDNVVGAIDIKTAQIQDEELGDDEKISLQSFLNMTNIHFIELSTTKRRHTLAQSLPARPSQESTESRLSSETCFVAAATTLPLLELYQHATRELKSYISSGRKIVRSIEAETLQEQPKLFREYVDSRPDVRTIMDNQFRNGKANARLQSKEGWYTWRAQLVEGLKGGLLGIKSGITKDTIILDEQQQMLDDIVPKVTDERIQLQETLDSLQQNLDELDNVDFEALELSRKQLQNADDEYLQKLRLLEDLQAEAEEKKETLAAAAEVMTEMQDQIDEASRVVAENRGWPASDVLALKKKVDTIQEQCHWNLLTAEDDDEESTDFGVALTMEYKGQVRLFFYPSMFQLSSTVGRRRSGRKSKSVSGPTAPISLSYFSAHDKEAAVQGTLSTERRFFLQLIRSQLHAFTMMPKGAIPSRTILETVSRGWDLCEKVSEELRLLNTAGLSNVSIRGDEKIGVTTTLILPGKSRVDVDFTSTVSLSGDGGIILNTVVSAHGVYGSVAGLLTGSRAKKVQNALTKEIETKDIGKGSWVEAIHAFRQWVNSQSMTQITQKQPEAPANSIPVQSQTFAPVSSSTTPKRSPLAPKRSNVVHKKTLPVPKQRVEKVSQVYANEEKENLAPVIGPPRSPLLKEPDRIENVKPAMPPEMQEAMMHTPIKRVGALRRSPI